MTTGILTEATSPHLGTPAPPTPETVEWAARYEYTNVAFLTAMDMTEALFDIYRRRDTSLAMSPVRNISATCYAAIWVRSIELFAKEALPAVTAW